MLIDPSKINTTTRKYTDAVKLYNEGWMEFNDKKIAKSVAFSLNNTKIGKSFNFQCT